ncbi:hypothetical protein Cylst_6686 (plasmid) [Cylindrospermum stagnale PCC 7417]|uniref:Uncharacterized protein n=1 Tax=Cylindrospermum stagnale PCC 7417 TaxID=56107 RepID=K9X8P4_9NOST|nr:hypothetical protein [Cylindrospermum stagnale]AFZ28441.1 hypothetical protein Cylst_6686 [Cylindrospermum stagnale PCC 7417]
MAIAKTRANNNTRNAANSKASAKANNTANATKSKETNASPQQEALAILKELRNLIFKEYGIKLQLRDSRISTKVGHAAREKLGLDIAAQVKKKGGKRLFVKDYEARERDFESRFNIKRIMTV